MCNIYRIKSNLYTIIQPYLSIYSICRLSVFLSICLSSYLPILSYLSFLYYRFYLSYLSGLSYISYPSYLLYVFYPFYPIYPMDRIYRIYLIYPIDIILLLSNSSILSYIISIHIVSILFDYLSVYLINPDQSSHPSN